MMKKDSETCGSCGASSEGDNSKMGNCRLNPPLIRRDSVIDTYPTVQLDNPGCLQHTKRGGKKSEK
jgi:hypothetical protein